MDYQIGQELTVYGIARWKVGKVQIRHVVVSAYNPETGHTYVSTPRGVLLTLGIEVFLNASDAVAAIRRKLDRKIISLRSLANAYERVRDQIDQKG